MSILKMPIIEERGYSLINEYVVENPDKFSEVIENMIKIDSSVKEVLISYNGDDRDFLLGNGSYNLFFHRGFKSKEVKVPGLFFPDLLPVSFSPLFGGWRKIINSDIKDLKPKIREAFDYVSPSFGIRITVKEDQFKIYTNRK